MKLKKLFGMTALWVVVALPAFAQIDRVVVEAVNGDIDCLPCAATIEMALKKVPGVAKVAVSMSKQMVAITFNEGAPFTPDQYRAAIAKAEVRVQSLHVAMRGQVEQEGDKQYFVAGKDRYLIVKAPEGMPTGAPLGIMAEVDDSSKPIKFSVDDFKPQQ